MRFGGLALWQFPDDTRKPWVAAGITDSVITVSVIYSFADAGTEDIFHGRDSAAARRRCPSAVWPVARRKLDQLHWVDRLDDLRVPPGNRLERLQGNRFGQHSIRINRQYRICFRWEDGNATQVEVTDYH